MQNRNMHTEYHIGRSTFYLILLMLIPMLTMIIFHDYPYISTSCLLLFICLSIYIIYNYQKQDKKFASTYQWEVVNAQVINKKIIKFNCITLHSHIPKYEKDPHMFKIRITYKYTYGNQKYTSKKYALSYSDDTKNCNYNYTISEANKTMYRITKDKKVKIYVNPENPEESVIERGKSSLYSFSYGLVIVYIVVLSTLMYLVLTV